jgi:hypothetical protein
VRRPPTDDQPRAVGGTRKRVTCSRNDTRCMLERNGLPAPAEQIQLLVSAWKVAEGERGRRIAQFCLQGIRSAAGLRRARKGFEDLLR